MARNYTDKETVQRDAGVAKPIARARRVYVCCVS